MSIARRYCPSININEIMLQTFDGKEVDRILGVDTLFGCLIFYVIFKNDDQPFRLSYAADFNLAFPAEVIKFYENRINWLEDLDSEEVQEKKALEALSRRFIKDHNIVFIDKNGEMKVQVQPKNYIEIETGQVSDSEEIIKSQENDYKFGNNDYKSQMNILPLSSGTNEENDIKTGNIDPQMDILSISSGTNEENDIKNVDNDSQMDILSLSPGINEENDFKTCDKDPQMEILSISSGTNEENDIKNVDNDSQMDILSISSGINEEVSTSVQEANDLDNIMKSKKPSLSSTPKPLRKKSILIPFQEEKRKKRKHVKKCDSNSNCDQSGSLKLNETLKSKLNIVYSTFDTEIVNRPSTPSSSTSSRPSPFSKFNTFPNLKKLYLNDLHKNASTSTPSASPNLTPAKPSGQETDSHSDDNDKNNDKKSSKFTFDPDMLIYDDSSDSDDDGSKSKRQNNWK